MSTTDQERTEQYADVIADRVRMIEALADVPRLDDPDDLANLDAAKLGTLAELVDFTHPAYPTGNDRDLVFLLDPLAEHAADYLEDHGGSVVEAWLEGVLDIEATYRGSLAGLSAHDDLVSIAVVVTVGGPDARVYLDDIDGRARVEVQWWGSSARRYLHAPNLAARVYDLEEAVREVTR